MQLLSVFVIFISLFCPFFSGAASDYPADECGKSFSSGTAENPHQRAESLLVPISVSSSNEVADMLRQESPETLKILTQRVFSMPGMVRTKYNLAFALGEKQTDDPVIHRILSDALLGEEHKGVVREVAHALGKINGKINPRDFITQKNLLEVAQSKQEIGIRLKAIDALGETRSQISSIHQAFFRMLLSEKESLLVKQAIVKALIKMKPLGLDAGELLYTALFFEKIAIKTKQFIAEVLGEMPMPEPTRLHEMARALFKQEEFETEEGIVLKQKIAEAIKKLESKDSKLQELLTEFLTVFKEAKYALVRQEIYDLFEIISQHIKVKAGRRLAGMVGSDEYSSEDKLRAVGILKLSRLIDALTLEKLSKGLDDPSSKVRGAIAEALGDILLIPARQNFLKRVYDKTVYPLLVHPAKNMFNGKEKTVKNIRYHIIEKLTDIAEHDPDPFIQEAAVQAIVKMDDGQAPVDVNALIQNRPSEQDLLPVEEAVPNEEMEAKP